MSKFIAIGDTYINLAYVKSVTFKGNTCKLTIRNTEVGEDYNEKRCFDKVYKVEGPTCYNLRQFLDSIAIR